MMNHFESIFSCDNPTISVVVACMDRTENLITNLEACLIIPQIKEIIVLDYGSKNELSKELPNHIKSKIKLYRINATHWHLTKAYNIAIQLSSCDIIVKLDADYLLDKKFFINHHIKPNEYISGFDRYDSLSGFLMLYKNDFIKINGYNERIITYGYDDDDINQRLKKHNITYKRLDRSMIKHLPHDKNNKEWFKNAPPESQDLSRGALIIQNKKIAHEKPWTNKDKMSKYNTTSAFVACMNRKNNLIKSIESWIQTKYFDEIIVLDYGSDPAISDIWQNEIVKIYRESAKFWHLTKAYNIAAQLTKGDIIVKLDSDYYLNKNFFKQNIFNFDSKSFYTGNGCRIQSLWGFLMLERKHFFDVNGYNERIIGWGHDDVDINQRLKSIGLKSKIINTENIKHLFHSNLVRNLHTKENLDICKSRKKNLKTIQESPWTKNDIMSKHKND